jgi:hypothetical protein
MSPDALLRRIEVLERNNKTLRESIKDKDEKLSSFLADEEIAALGKANQSHWGDSSVIKGLKMRFALGKHGYKFLRNTGYPAPSYSTLNRRIQNVKFDFGVLKICSSLKNKSCSNENR